MYPALPQDLRERLSTQPKGQELAGMVVAALVGFGVNTTLSIVVVGNQHPYYLGILAGWMADWPISLLLLLLPCFAH